MKRRRSVSSFPLPKCIPALARTTEDAAPDKAEQHNASGLDEAAAQCPSPSHVEPGRERRRHRGVKRGSRSPPSNSTQYDHTTTNSLWSRMTRPRSHGDGMGSGDGGGAECSLPFPHDPAASKSRSWRHPTHDKSNTTLDVCRSGRAAEYPTAPTAAAAPILPALKPAPQDRSLGTTTTKTVGSPATTATTAAAPSRPNFVSGNEYMFSIFDSNPDMDEEISNMNFTFD